MRNFISRVCSVYIRNKYRGAVELKPPLGTLKKWYDIGIFEFLWLRFTRKIWKIDNFLFYEFREDWDWWKKRAAYLAGIGPRF